jgi:hypothetical protein
MKSEKKCQFCGRVGSTKEINAFHLKRCAWKDLFFEAKRSAE